MSMHDVFEIFLVRLDGLLMFELVLILHLFSPFLGLFFKEMQIDIKIVNGTSKSFDLFLPSYCIFFQLHLHISFET